MKYILPLLIIIFISSCRETDKKKDSPITKVNYIEKAPTVDGKAIENFWNLIEWQALDQNWLGGPLDHEDFSGKFKIAWNEEALYLLIEIVDDSLVDKNKDPLKLWWNDDCLEVLVDEDNSGGLHQYNNNAFAYKVALDGNVVDVGPNKKPRLLNDHIKSANITEDNISIWELAIYVYPEDFENGTVVNPVQLYNDKKIGFALAYCDNDSSTERENLIGSVFIPGEDKNQGWINADIFGTLVLEK